MSDSPTPAPQPQYKDDDLVYVDPDTRTVIGLVEWGKNEKPKSLPYKKVVKELPMPAPVAPAVAAKTAAPADAKKGRGKPKEEGSHWRKYYPWGTYRSMKKIYKLEGKQKEPEPHKTLEEILPKALSTAFWND